MKKGLRNVVFGVGGQLIILALGVLIPRFVLNSYGDEVNGLINAINQMFVYLALIEAGIGQATVQALYKPIVEKQHDSISEIVSATQYYFRKLTYLYMLIVTVFAFIYPLFIRETDLTPVYLFNSQYFGIAAFIIVHGLSSAISFYYSSALKQLLIADGYNYYISNITTISRIVSSIVKIVLVNLGINIVLLQVIYLFITIVEVSCYVVIINKKYKWLSLKQVKETTVLHERKAFLIHEISNAVFSSTDMLVLSLFCDLKTVSIYAIYNLVFSSINSLINQVHSGCFYILGQSYNRNRDRYQVIHDCYDTCYIAFVFSFISVTYILIIPFVSLYTRGVTDLDYIDRILPVLFSLIHLLSSCRITSSTLIKIAGHAKQTVSRTIAEAVINLTVSIILVKLIGIYGVLLGTIVALLYRTNDMLIYANTRILNRKPFKTYKVIFINFALFTVLVVICSRMTIMIDTYTKFVLYGIIASIFSVIYYFSASLLVDRRTTKQLVMLLTVNSHGN